MPALGSPEKGHRADMKNLDGLLATRDPFS